MRIWEFDDKRSIPSDLVREQDFILRLRRLQRLGTPHLVLNLALNELDQVVTSRRALEATQEKLKEFARVTNGAYAEMSNGDVFLIWEETADAALLTAPILKAIMPADAPDDLADKLLHAYHMPQDYNPLRERSNAYIEMVRTVAATTDKSPAEALRNVQQGPLTAWSVDQIGRLLSDIDLKPYSRRQTIYRRGTDGKFTPYAEELYISFDELKRDRFPRLDIITPEHFFMALCQMLDQKFLAVLIEEPPTIKDTPLWFNVAVGSVMGALFTQFAHTIPDDRRKLIGFKIHRGDVLQDFALTLNAIEVLHRQGFRVALDAMTPDMLGYVDFTAFHADLYKISVSRDRAALLNDPERRKQLAVIPRDKLVFMRCDSDAALEQGIANGVTLYQGWKIDELVAAQ